MVITHQQKIILVAVIVIALIIGGFALSRSVASDEIVINTQFSTNLPRPEKALNINNNQLVVYVTGAVKTEGVVKLRAASRLIDALAAAGGLQENADLAKVNLAEKIKDGQKIEIHFKITAPPQTMSSAKAPDVGNKAGLINVNTASAKDLQTVKGIGSKMSQDIIDYREANGAFSNLDDLKKVKGIGKATLNKIRGFLCV